MDRVFKTNIKQSKVFGGETHQNLSLSLSLSTCICIYTYIGHHFFKNSCSLGGHWSSCMRSWPNWSFAGAGQNVTANCGWCFVQRTSLRSGCSLEAHSGNLSSSRYSRWIYRRARDHVMYHDFAITLPITLLSMPGPVSINGVSHISNCLQSFFPAAFHQIMCVIYYFIIFPSSICHHHGFHHLHLSLIGSSNFPSCPPRSGHFPALLPMSFPLPSGKLT